MDNNIGSNINPNTTSLFNNISNNKTSEKKNKDTTIKVSLEVKKMFDTVAEELKNENPKLNTNSLVIENLIRKYNELVYGKVELDAMPNNELLDYEFYDIIDGVEILELYNSKPIQNINIVILELLFSKKETTNENKKTEINKLLNYIKASYEEYMHSILSILSNFGNDIYICHTSDEYNEKKKQIIDAKRKANSKETAKRAKASLKEAMTSDGGAAFIKELDDKEGKKLLELLRKKYEVGNANTTQELPTGETETSAQPPQAQATGETETSTPQAQATDETETSSQATGGTVPIATPTPIVSTTPMLSTQAIPQAQATGGTVPIATPTPIVSTTPMLSTQAIPQAQATGETNV